MVIGPFPRPFFDSKPSILPSPLDYCGIEAVQELSSTWWGSVTEEPLGKVAGFSRPFKKKVSSSPFPFTKIGPRLTKRKPYSRRMACVSSTTCRGRTVQSLGLESEPRLRLPKWDPHVILRSQSSRPVCSSLLPGSSPLHSMRESTRARGVASPLPKLVCSISPHSHRAPVWLHDCLGLFLPALLSPLPLFVELSCQTQRIEVRESC